MAERQFGPYSLVHQIAVGGMAEIHLAKTGGIAGFEKYVALKMIHPNFSEDEQFIQMLIDEAKITVQLQHVNIAQTFDLGRVGDFYYITMEYVDGCDLYQLLRRSSEQDIETPFDICAFVAKEVATGLDYAHRKRDHQGRPLGIVHRDVSPQNVLISHAGEVKLVDFGIAKATMRARQTAVGVIKGKYYYMSPEQAWGDRLDHRSDVFSAGILLYEMLTGQMLYLEEDVQKLLGMVRKAAIAPPTTLRPGIPPQLERIVMHCLQKRPDDRYRTAADLAADLERFLHVYSPVFTAGKLSKHVADVMDVEFTPPPIEPPKSDAMRSARRITQRVDQSAVLRSREEFTDENSVIFNVHDMARQLANDETPQPRMAQSLTRQVPDEDFTEDRTIIDDMPPMFETPPPELAAPEELDDDTTDVRPIGDDSADEEAPTMALDAGQHPSGLGAGDVDPLEPPTHRRVRKLPLGPAEAALGARVQPPAVSLARPPRKSRRTPPEGLPKLPDRMPLVAEPSRPSGSVISSLIDDAIHTGPTSTRGPAGLIRDPDEVPTVDQVKAVRTRPVNQHVDDSIPPVPGAANLRPAPRPSPPPPMFRPPPAALNTGALHALEIDAIPDAFKVGRGGVPRWVWRVGLAVVCVILGVMIGLFWLEDEDAPATASMEIVSIPEGATVTINGQRQAGTTPIIMPRVEPGTQYRIVVELDGYRTWDRRENIPLEGGPVKVIASLKPVLVTLTVESTPPEAEVFLNGRSVGRTPLTLTRLEPTAARIIELRKVGYTPERRTLDWSTKTTQRQQFTLEK